MKADESVEFKNKKEQFVMAEYSLLKRWGRILNKEQDGAGWMYLVIQVYKNKESGVAWPSIRRLATLTGYSTSKVQRILYCLESHSLIKKRKSKRVMSNVYEIPPLPKPPIIDDPDEFKQPEETKVFGAVTVDEAVTKANNLSEKRNKEYLTKLESRKELKKWNGNDLMKFFSAFYQVTFGLPMKKKTTEMRDRANWKQMVGNYGPERTKKTIEYALKNWTDLSYTKGYPDHRAFFAFRGSLFPEAVSGKARKQAYDYDDVGIGG